MSTREAKNYVNCHVRERIGIMLSICQWYSNKASMMARIVEWWKVYA